MLQTTTRKKMGQLLLGCYLAGFVISNEAVANSFESGRSVGSAGNNAALNAATGGVDLPTFGGSGDTGSLTTRYPGAGKDNPTAITNLMAAGMAEQNVRCNDGDNSCAGRSFVQQRYSAASGTNYRAAAEGMRTTAQNRNPEDVLGLDMPTEGATTVCTETTVNLPDGTMEKQCLDATLQQTTYFTKLPVTTEYDYTNPVCMDGYYLNGDKSVCLEDVYSCPLGTTLNGIECVEITDGDISYQGLIDCSALPSMSFARNSQDYIYISATCNADRTGLSVYSDAYGSRGGLYRGTRGEFSIAETYANEPVTILAPHWGGAYRQSGVFVSGGCDSGACNYTFKFGWASNPWAYLTLGDSRPGHDSTSGYYRNPNLSDGGTVYGGCKSYTGSWYSDDGGNMNYQYTCTVPNSYTFGRMNLTGTVFSRSIEFADPREKVVICPDGFTANSQDKCERKFPATHTVNEAQPGCMGGQVTSAGQIIVSAPEHKEDDRTPEAGDYMCVSEQYSCPAGMAMNGNKCEDSNRMQYENNPDCINLGYVPETETEGYLCTTQELTECAEMPSDCTEISSECVYTDTMSGSATEGQCIATERTFSCPVPGESIVSETCGYQPMCIDGNCFEQEEKCPTVPGVNPIQHYDETCQNLTREDIETCPITYIYGEPDEDGDRPIIGGEVDTNTCTWATQDNCTMAPVKQITDDDGNSSWPANANFSCLGDTLELCAKLDADSECTLTRTQNEQYSIDGGTPIVQSKHFNCARTITVPTDTCTEDFAKMAVSVEASRQAGEYFDPDSVKIFSGEFHRCDRRAVGLFGANLGSKSCCNISAPDPQSNNDVLADMKQQIYTQGAMGLIDYSIDSGSSYVYDFMMDSEFYQSISTKLFSTAVEASTVASQADMLAEQTADFANASYGISYAGFGIAHTGTQAVAGQTLSSGGWTGTSSWSLGGGFEMQFSPVGLYVYAAMTLYQMYQAALACDEADYKTATLSKGKLCYSHGSWCQNEDCGLFGCVCTKYRTGKCCFNSKLARIINQQGRAQLGLSMRDCNGFTVEQIEQLDWSQIDLSEFIADMLNQAQANLPKAADLQRLNDKIIDNIDNSSSGGVQPVDLGVNGQKRIHN